MKLLVLSLLFLFLFILSLGIIEVKDINLQVKLYKIQEILLVFYIFLTFTLALLFVILG